MKRSTVCVFLALSLSTLVAAKSAPIAKCSFLSYKTYQLVKLFDDGSVATGAETDTELSDFVLTHLPDRHIHIMRHDTGTYLVYGNGSFTHGQPDGDNHIFRVEYEIDEQVIALKAVNHKHENRIDLGSGSGMEAEEGEDMTDTMVVESECYLAISQEGKPFCHPSKFTETPILDILFFSPCFN